MFSVKMGGSWIPHLNIGQIYSKVGGYWKEAGQVSSKVGGTYKNTWNMFVCGHNSYGELARRDYFSPIPLKIPMSLSDVYADQNFSVSIDSNGYLWAWGYDQYAQCGQGTTVLRRLTPVQIGTSTWKMVSGRMAIRADNTLWGWGAQYLGDGTTTLKYSPAQAGTSAWKTISIGLGWHALGIKTDNTLWAWGSSDSQGQCGQGVTAASRPTAVQVGTSTWKMVSAGGLHSLGIRSDNTLWAWGNDSNGQCGQGSNTTNRPTPVQIGTSTWKSIFSGYNHSLGIRADDTLWAWGYDGYGQCGQDSTSSSRPTLLQIGTSTWKTVAAGQYNSFAILADDTLWAWGMTDYGQCGIIGGSSFILTPQQIGTSTWKKISSGLSHVVGIDFNNKAYTWGSNIYGAILLGEEKVAIPTLSSFFQKAMWSKACQTRGSFSLAIKEVDNTLWSWGANEDGQCGQGVSSFKEKFPAQIGTSSWKMACGGDWHALAIKSDDTLWAWGSDNYGQCGQGGTAPERLNPVRISSSTFKVVAAGSTHSLGIRSDNTLWAWGSDGSGQCGQGTMTSVRPIVQIGTSTWKMIAGGNYHSLGIRADNTLWAWGSDSKGQCGQGVTAANRLTPVQVGTSTWKAINAGSEYSLGIRADDTLWAWGSNVFYQCGQGTGQPSILPTPVQVGAGSTWKAITSGSTNGYAIRSDDTLWAWGSNGSGQCGQGNTDTYAGALPVQIGTSTWRTIAAGSNHLMALL